MMVMLHFDRNLGSNWKHCRLRDMASLSPSGMFWGERGTHREREREREGERETNAYFTHIHTVSYYYNNQHQVCLSSQKICDLVTIHFIFLHLLEGRECSWKGNEGEEEREER